jgi:hypothetical protein
MKDQIDRPDEKKLAINRLADSDNGTNNKPAGVDASRRRLFGAGIAAPIILTMSSRTAWGGALCSPSAFNSATFSSHHPTESQECLESAGWQPSTWASSTASWPASYMPDESVIVNQPNNQQREMACKLVTGVPSYRGFYLDTLNNVYCRNLDSFDAVFNVSLFNDDTTLLEVLLNSPGDSIETHAVAALLNAATGSNLFGQVSSGAAVTLVLSLFPTFIVDPLASVTLPNSTTSVSWLGGSFSMKSYFTNYAS